MLNVVAGIIINEDQEILIAKRPKLKSFGGYWEFPGGKIEQDETPFAALKRELAEEIGIKVITARPYHQLSYNYPTKTVVLNFWQVQEFLGLTQGIEGQIVKWIKIHDLLLYKFMPANKEIILRLLRV